MGWLEALILGILQGLTEFLPVSSSGHIELGKALLNTNQQEDPLLFTILVHGATALSTIVVFRKDIVTLIKGLFEFKWNDSAKYFVFIVVSMIPAAIVGVFFEDEINAFFDGNLLLVGCMLIFTAILLFLTTKTPEKPGKVSAPKAFLIGIMQAIAILPGVSRSGSTISLSLLLGISRENAARFSFLMVLPLIFGAMLLKIKALFDTAEAGATVEISALPLIIGFIAAFASGVLACKWMIKLVKNSKLIYFALYCLIVGGIAIASGIL